MKHLKINHEDLSLDDYLAKVDTVTRLSEKSILKDSGLLKMPEDEDDAKKFAIDIVTGKASKYLFQRTLDKWTECPMMTVVITDIHTTKPVKENVGKKKLTYQEFALWVRNEDTGTRSFLWFKNFKDLKTGLWQFEVKEGAALTAQLTYLPAKHKLVNLSKAKKFTFQQYTVDTLVQCGGPWNTRTAKDTDILSQAAFASASSASVFQTKFKLNFSL